MDEIELKNFIFEASRATYASGDESLKHKEGDGSTTIVYEKGGYKMHDNYFGGEPYCGREVIFLENKAIWMMVYYGLVYEGVVHADVYKFLMSALSNNTNEMPYRGPTLYEKDNWRYENSFVGDVSNLSGTEKIFKDNLCVYEASYLGGFVDR